MIEDLDFNALGISTIMALIVGWLLLADPLNVGMSSVNLWGRIAGIIVGWVAGYFIADRMINQ